MDLDSEHEDTHDDGSVDLSREVWAKKLYDVDISNLRKIFR
jgi:hypothetical protein